MTRLTHISYDELGAARVAFLLPHPLANAISQVNNAARGRDGQPLRDDLGRLLMLGGGIPALPLRFRRA